METQRAKPFVKWAGGKGQLLPNLKSLLPRNYRRYFEPFLGGGALYFYLNPASATLNDINPTLIDAYNTIKNNPRKVIKILKEIEKGYKKRTDDQRKELYYIIRDKYNSLPKGDINRSCYLIFLNRTCYNGMYRENLKGQFNIPFGRHKNPQICDEENIMLVSSQLKTAELFSDSYIECVKSARSKDFVYFDPPYYPINDTSSFTSYSESGFRELDQVKLYQVFDELSRKGCYVMLSNSNTDFIKRLYKKYLKYTVFVEASRAINCKAKGRGKITELIIRNYL